MTKKQNGHPRNETLQEFHKEASRRLAAVSLSNDWTLEADQRSALETAARAGVTITEYLRARLLLEARIDVWPPVSLPHRSLLLANFDIA